MEVRTDEWSMGLLIGWFIYLLVGWLVGWLVYLLVGWLVRGWLVGWLLVGCLHSFRNQQTHKHGGNGQKKGKR